MSLTPPAPRSTVSDAAKTKWWKKRWVQVVVGMVVVGGIANAMEATPSSDDGGRGSSTEAGQVAAPTTVEVLALDTTTSSTSTSTTTVVSTTTTVALPEEQARFLEVFESAKDMISSADNTLQRADALRKRDEALCTVLGNGVAENWVGTVETIGATRDGNAYLEVEFGNRVQLQTRFGELGDLGRDTLIKPGGALYESLLGIESGDSVRFTATLLGSDEGCLTRENLTITFYSVWPEFLTRFSRVEKLG